MQLHDCPLTRGERFEKIARQLSDFRTVRPIDGFLLENVPPGSEEMAEKICLAASRNGFAAAVYPDDADGRSLLTRPYTTCGAPGAR